MCTAISFLTNDHYFGRNLDLEYHYNEQVTIMPRNFPLNFTSEAKQLHHYAMIGVATIDNGYPLYYDATNEYGLSIAGLNFPGNAVYLPPSDSAINVASFELIPWLLCQCKNVDEAYRMLQNVRIVNTAYNKKFSPTPLHWIISDSTQSITLEPMENQLFIYKNPIGVLTNNPSFPFHMENLKQYLNLTSNEPECKISPKLKLTPFSRGLGAIGLPGDFSSASRFIRAAFVKENSICDNTEISSVMQFFHILQTVQQPNGCVKLNNGNQRTIYSSCCNTTKGIFYYSTYENSQISAVNMHNEDLNDNKLISYNLIHNQSIKYMN